MEHIGLRGRALGAPYLTSYKLNHGLIVDIYDIRNTGSKTGQWRRKRNHER